MKSLYSSNIRRLCLTLLVPSDRLTLEVILGALLSGMPCLDLPGLWGTGRPRPEATANTALSILKLIVLCQHDRPPDYLFSI